MDGKIEQCVCIQFCMKLGKSATKTLEMLREAFGEHSLSQRVVFELHSHQLKVTNVQGNQAPAKRQKMLKKFEKSSTKNVTEQSMSSQTLLGSVMEFARS
jgi:ribonuclease HIII